MSNIIPPPRQSSPHLLTPTNTPPTHHNLNHPHSPQPMLENFPDHRQHLLAIFSQGTHSFCQEDREEEIVERRKSFIEQSYPTPSGSRRPSFLSGLQLSRPRPFVFTNTNTNTTPSQPSSGASTPIHPSSPQNTTHAHSHLHHLPTNPKSTAMTPTTSLDTQPVLGQVAVVGSDGIAKKKISGFEGKKVEQKGGVVGDRRHFDPSREPRLLHLL